MSSRAGSLKNEGSHPRMRVALIGPNYSPQVGGVELHLERLADGLVALGCDVEVLVQHRHNDVPVPPVDVRPSGVTVRWFRSRTYSHRFPVAPSLILHLIRSKKRYDVVHGHSFHALPGPLAALIGHRPFVFTGHYHGGGHTFAARVLHRVYAPLGRLAFREASSVLCNSKYEADCVDADFNLSPEKIKIIYPGVDVEEIASAEPFVTDTPILLAAGRLEDYKQLDLAVRALALIASPCKMVILGNGPARQRLEDLVKELGVEARVEFKGRLPFDDVRRWLRTADVVLTLSRHEAFGLVLLEAAAAGANVLASSIPAHQEIAAFAGSAVRFIDVDAKPQQVAEAIDEQLLLGRRSPQRDGIPSWNDLAARCFAVYTEALEKTGVGE